MKADSPLVATLSPSPNFGERRGRTVDALILHYTGMASGALARARLRDPAAEVSCHYLVWEDGRIEQLVAEADRAWHAGRSSWAGETDMNAVSIGIEIVNGGHDLGCPPYPEPQIAAVIALAHDICVRHAIAPRRVLAHSDIAPDRKRDPGEWFFWDRLASAGVGLWLEPQPPGEPITFSRGADDRVLALQRGLSAFGYACAPTGLLDGATTAAITAFQRHYRPARVDGRIDASTLATLDGLLRLRP